MATNNFDSLLKQKVDQARPTELDQNVINTNKDNEVHLFLQF